MQARSLRVFPTKREEQVEKILVWDNFPKTIELRRLLMENLPKGFAVENSNGSSDDSPVCTINSDSGICGLLPVVCEDPRANDTDYWKPLAFAAPPSLFDYGVILAKLNHQNVTFILPRLAWSVQTKPDLALYVYTDDKEELKKPLDQQFQWVADYVDMSDKDGTIHLREELSAMVKDRRLFEGIRTYHRRKRILLVEPAPIDAARYEGMIIAGHRLTPYYAQSLDEALGRVHQFGFVLANIDDEKMDWRALAQRINRAAPETRLVFYSNHVVPDFPFCFRPYACVENDGFDAQFLDGDINRSLQCGALERITEREETRRYLKKAGVFDSLKRLETEGTSEDKLFYDLKERINPSK